MFPIIDASKSCHMCDFTSHKPIFYSCTNNPHCTKHYCISCVKNHYSSQSSPDQYRLQTWLCYSCQSKCLCSKCYRKKSDDFNFRFSLNDFNDTKGNKIQKKALNEKNTATKKTIQFNIMNGFQQKEKVISILDLDEESQEYVTPSDLKAMQKFSQNNQYSRLVQNEQIQLFQVFKQESMTPHDYSSELNIANERKSKTIIKCKKQRNFVGLKVEKLPPYLESIMKRKQTFRNFMIRHSKKSYEQLVREEDERIQLEKNSQNFVQKFQRVDMPSPVMKSSFINSASIIDQFMSPLKIPETPSFVPISEPLFASIPSELKITDLLNEQLKEYEMEDEDLSLELL